MAAPLDEAPRSSTGWKTSVSMIPRITIAEAARHVGETVEIAGWLYNLRKSGKIVFPIVRDGTGLMQCVAVKSALPEELFETIKNLTQESSSS
jgi:asparaginyl-tRNA synthetase